MQTSTSREVRFRLIYCCYGLLLSMFSGFMTAAQTADKPAPRPHPSMEEFESVFAQVGSVDPGERDYTSILGHIEALMRKYPGTEAALLSIIAVEKWKEKGFITEQDIKPLQEMRDRFNPGKNELAHLHGRYEVARRQEDQEALAKVASDMAAIAEKYPGTLTRYIALSNLSDVYVRAGETKKALETVRAFLKEYPPGQTAMATASTMEHANLFREASLTAKAESVGAGLAKYRQIAESHSGQNAYVIPALYAGGQLALNNERLDDALDLFMNLAAAAPEQTDYRITLAFFRIGEVLLRQMDPDAALDIFRELQSKHQNDRFAKEAADWITFSNEIKAKLEAEKRPPTIGGQSPGELLLKEETGKTSGDFAAEEIEAFVRIDSKKIPESERVHILPTPSREPAMSTDTGKAEAPISGEQGSSAFNKSIVVFVIVAAATLGGAILFLLAKRRQCWHTRP